MKNKIQQLYQSLPKWLKNGYSISGIIFLIWILFFDTNSMLTHINKQREIKSLEKDINYYKKQIQQDGELIKIVIQDSLTKSLEKHLREQLLLSRSIEEIFIIE